MYSEDKIYNLKEILKKYWGYDDFRDIQLDIINSILQKRDTLALLPTGGGKSICFQVPAMCQEGICLVVSPLISLMKDQVFNLEKVGIKAFCATSDVENSLLYSVLETMSYSEEIKFLYVSPERLKSKIFLEYLKNINISFIAVDEAHCISQWGHDFRPEYMKIGEIRNLFDVPILALTASATPKVITEIQKNLNFKKENIFKKSFERKNLSYIVIKKENKLDTVLLILKRIEGSAIIYVRNRRKTKEISDWLNSKGFKSDYYHAGLNSVIREMKQEEWKSDKIRIIVATNAFGMGIDKPDVRLVFHIDFADSIESYFQEAGRAGRDGKESKCITILSKSDIDSFHKNTSNNKIDIDYIKKILEYLYNLYFINEDTDIYKKYDFSIEDFIKKYNVDVNKLVRILDFLNQNEIIRINDYENIFTKIKIICSSDYILNLKDSLKKEILIFLLRKYTGILTDEVKINEFKIASNFKISIEKLDDLLESLSNSEFISYKKKNKKQTITFLVNNDKRIINTIKDKIDLYNKRLEFKSKNIYNYIVKDICRNIILLDYFGEEDYKKCGKCDVCLKNLKSEVINNSLKEYILKILLLKKITSQELCIELKNYQEEDILKVLDYLLNEEKIFFDECNRMNIRA